MANAAYRGWAPRQQRVLDLWSAYLGTHYDARLPWQPDTTSGGKKIPREHRKPRVQLGTLGTIADRLRDRLTGEGRFCTVSTTDAGLDAALEAVRLRVAVSTPVLRAIVQGSAGIALHYQRPEGGEGRWMPVLLATEWCSVIFAAQVDTALARRFAADLRESGVPVPDGDDGEPRLPMPVDAAPEDVIFVRYQYRYDDEDAQSQVGRSDAVVWTRTDYLADAVVTYQDVSLTPTASAPVGFTVDNVEPLAWGLCPVAWLRSPGAEPGQQDGPSAFTPAVRSQAEAADYAASYGADGSVGAADPNLWMNDVRDVVGDLNIEAGGSSSDIGTRDIIVTQSDPSGTPKVELIETSGEGAKTAAESAERLANGAKSAAGLVEWTSETATGVLSGVALERLMEPTFGRVRLWRTAVGAFVRDFVELLMWARSAEESGAVVAIPDPQWPALQPPTPADVQAWATAYGTAAGQGLLSSEDAARMFAEALGLDAADEVAARAAGDADRRMRDALGDLG